MRKFIPAALIVAAILGMVAVADALIITESEEVSRFADALTDDPPQDRLDAIIERTEQSSSVEVIVNRNRGRYSNSSAAPAIRNAFEPLESEDLDVLQQTVSVEGPTAMVALRFESEGERYNAEFHLSHVDGAWQIDRLRIN